MSHRHLLVVLSLALAACAQLQGLMGKASSSPSSSPSASAPDATATRSEDHADAPAHGDGPVSLVPGAPDYVDPGPFAGPLAKKYAGKVVFTSRPVPMDGKDDSAVYTSYPLGQPLYIRYWGKDSPHNLLPDCSKPRLVLRADVNDEQASAREPASNFDSFGDYDSASDQLEERSMSSLSNELDLAFTTRVSYDPADREEAGRSTVRQFNSDIVPRLHEGKNTLRIVLTLDCGAAIGDSPIVAEGSIEVVVKPGALAAYIHKYGPQLAASRHRENAKLAPQMIAAMKKQPDWDNEEILFARVTSDAWEPIRNELTGVITEQAVDGVIGVRSRKEKNPERCRLFDMGFRRDASGGALYYYSTGSDTPIPCSSLGK